MVEHFQKLKVQLTLEQHMGWGVGTLTPPHPQSKNPYVMFDSPQT